MKAIDYVIEYGLPVFPCKPDGPDRKKPLTKHGFYDATTDVIRVLSWWNQWPNALAGMPTGRISRRWVLDIDTKNGANGHITLIDKRFYYPETAMAITPSGGHHVYFDAGNRELGSSSGLLGPGLDIRGEGGYVIVPTDGSGYEWDPFYDLSLPIAPAPDWLWVDKDVPATGEPIPPVVGLSPYGKAAINSACDAIVKAPAGQQEATLNGEAYSIGTLAGARCVPLETALRCLLRAARQMPSYDPERPWREDEIDHKVRRAFGHGLEHPRQVMHGLG